MLRLSIIVPYLGEPSSFEGTLVSILENRPQGTDVIVVADERYADPYRIADEVRFIRCDTGASLSARLNLGVSQSTADIVHFALPGIQVHEAWVEPALSGFSDPAVASVCPLVRMADAPRRPLVGVGYGTSGRRLLRCAAVPPPAASRSGLNTAELETAELDAAKLGVLGPAIHVGFFRKSYFELCGGFDERLGRFADVDLALSLHELEFRAHIETRSVVSSVSLPEISSTGYQDGLTAERLYRRHCGPAPGKWETWCHRALTASELVSALPHRALAKAFGRWKARGDVQAVEEHLRQMAESAKVARFLVGHERRKQEAAQSQAGVPLRRAA